MVEAKENRINSLKFLFNPKLYFSNNNLSRKWRKLGFYFLNYLKNCVYHMCHIVLRVVLSL